MRRERGVRGNALADFREPTRVWLLLERDDLSRSIEAEDAHGRGIGGRYRLRGDRDVGLAVDVRVDELAVVHAIELVAGEDQIVVGVVPLEVTARLAHGVGGALKPVRIVG